MAGKSVADIVKKWTDNTMGGVDAYKKGVAGVRVAPTQLAAQNLDKARQNYAAAIDSGRTAAALNNVTLAQWQAAAQGKGAANLQNGVRAAQTKMQASVAYWQPIAEQASAEAKAIPNNSEADALRRVQVVMQRMKQAAGKS